MSTQLYFSELKEPFYAVIFDAGSSGTRPDIYRIIPKVVDDGGNIKPSQVVEVLDHDGKSLKTTPVTAKGIQDQKDYPALEGYLDPLFDAVADLLNLLPTLPIKFYSFATEGAQDMFPNSLSELRLRVYEYVRKRGIAQNRFTYKAVSGTDKAKMGWVAANRSQGRPYDAGYVEMDEATAQIAFPLPVPAQAAATARKAAEKANMSPDTVYEAGGQARKEAEEVKKKAERVVKDIILATHEEMRSVYGDNYQSMREIWQLQSGDVQMLREVLRCGEIACECGLGRTGDSGRTKDLGPVAKLEDVIINLKGDMEKLMVVVKTWGGDMTLFRQVAERAALMVHPPAVWQLVDVIERVEMCKKAKLEIVGDQALFSGSYPLGSKAGYEAYETERI